jgi:hypothetical protein
MGTLGSWRVRLARALGVDAMDALRPPTVADAAKAVFVEEPQAYWRIELQSLMQCRQAVGPEVLNAFCRCFVQLERLASLIQLSFLSRLNRGPLSHSRNTQTIVSFSVATIHELTGAIRDLTTALIRSGLLKEGSEHHKQLCAAQRRWENDSRFPALWEIAAGHAETDLIERGLTAMNNHEPAVLSRGQGANLRDPSIVLGLDAIFRGCASTVVDFDRFLAELDDTGVAVVIHKVFLATLRAAGIPLETTDGLAASDLV